MCIALLSTAHPSYSLILLSNRDEFLSRPTAQAQWWEQPYSHVLGGRDLERKERGTWLGITSDGRIAVLTNFREEGVEVSKGKSRGGIVTAWLQPTVDTAKGVEEFAHVMLENVGIHDVGGFSLVYGHLRRDRGDGLAIISNRTESAGELLHIAKAAGETHGLSNSHYGDLSWPKVVYGEMLLTQAISSNLSRGDDEPKLIESLFDILCVDTLPLQKEGEDLVTYMRQLRNSIFIPPIGGETVETKRADDVASADNHVHGTATVSKQGAYGTQKQTVVLVNTAGRVIWTERTLRGNGPMLEFPDDERRIEFQIEGWDL